MKSYTHAPHTEDFHSPRPCRSGGPGKRAGRGVLAAGPTPQERAKVLGPAKGPRPQPTPAGWPEEQLPGGCAAPNSGAGFGRRARGTAREGGRAGAPRRPVAGKARAPRPAAWGRGGRACGLLGEFSPGLACGSPPGPRPWGPRRRRETHRKGPDPHLGVLPAARAFAQIRHGARPLPGGGFGSHSEAPVSHLRRAGRRGATLGAARPPGWAGELAGPWAAAAGAAAARARLGGCASAAAPRGPPHARLRSLYRAPPRWRRRRRRTNISLRRPNVLLLLLLRLSETRSGPEGGGGRREGGEPESGEIGGRGVGGREGEAGGSGGDAQISREESERAAPDWAGRSLGAGGVNRRGGGERGVGEVGGTSGAGRWERGGAEGGRRKLPF